MPRRERIRRIGLISDTHGLLRPEALDALRGVDHIVHAGDVGSPEVLEGLRAVAPLTAVRGNNDTERWARSLPHTAIVPFDGHVLFVVHELADLQRYPAPPETRAIVTGHSHHPSVRNENGVLYINPGSAGPRRFKLPVSVATLAIENGELRAKLLELSIAAKVRARH